MMRFLLALLVPLLVAAQSPGRVHSTISRLNPERLAAVKEARRQLAAKRAVMDIESVYEDYRAVLHVHAEDAAHTKGTRQQVLEAAVATGVNVVMLTDHGGPKPETWRGLRQGVLFIPGAEDDGQLRYPDEKLPLRFLSHLEERPEASAEGFDGMEIYNRHTDAKDESEFVAWFQKAMADPAAWEKLVELQRQYPDEFFASQQDYQALFTSYWDRQLAQRPFTAIAANDAHRNQIFKSEVFDPYEVSFRNASTHILARQLTESSIRAALRAGRTYVSHDWLCDATGFSFVAVNNLGVFDMGDRVPGTSNRLVARLPVEASLKLFRNGQLVQEWKGKELNFTAKEGGAYRLEAWLDVDGESRPWIYSGAIHMTGVAPAILFPPNVSSENVTIERGIDYAEGKPEDAAKHKLDLYLPKNKKLFPVLFFVHGGAWRSGDRSLYTALGNRFAGEGIGVVIPSYRLSPANLHPAHIEDVAAAFAWTVSSIAARGGDTGRIYIAGHSAGGHLVSLLTLDHRHLAKHGLKPSAIAGTFALSGVYNVDMLPNVFTQDQETRRQASPLTHVRAGLAAPPFLVTYCQWDYPFLPRQARLFQEALSKAGIKSDLVYVEGEDHISEILSIVKPGDATAAAILERIDQRER